MKFSYALVAVFTALAAAHPAPAGQPAPVALKPGPVLTEANFISDDKWATKRDTSTRSVTDVIGDGYDGVKHDLAILLDDEGNPAKGKLNKDVLAKLDKLKDKDEVKNRNRDKNHMNHKNNNGETVIIVINGGGNNNGNSCNNNIGNNSTGGNNTAATNATGALSAAGATANSTGVAAAARKRHVRRSLNVWDIDAA